MLIYIVVFIVSSVLFRIGQNRKNKVIKGLVLLCSILIPSLLAGYRDESVGRDYLAAYGSFVWDTACSADNFFDIPQYITQGLGFFYVLFNFLISRISSDVHILFFFHEFFVLFFVAYVCEKLKKDYNFGSWIVFSLFLLYLYNDSLNMLRQIMAVSIGFYCTYMMVIHKYFKSIILFFIAFFFHPSALLLLTQYPLLFLANKYRNHVPLLIFIICFSFMLVIGGAQFIIESFISNNVFDSRYEDYLNQDGFSSNKFDIMYLFVMIIVASVMASKQRQINPIYVYSICFALLGLFITMLGSVTEIASRLAFYYILPSFFLLPLAFCKKNYRAIITLLLLFFLTTRYVYTASFGNWSDTIPYKSKILNIK